MIYIDTSFENIKNYINKETNNNPDIIFKKVYFNKYDINVVFSESLTNRNVINDFILEFFHEVQLQNKKNIKDILSYLEQSIPANKIIRISKIKDMFYNLFSGFTLIFIDGEKECLSIETRAILNSSIAAAEREATLKGPKDAFTENYQLNLGLIRKRIKDKRLCLEELKIGKYSKTKVGIIHIKGIASSKLAKIIKNRFKEISIDAIYDTNNIMEQLSKNCKNVFPTFISTEKPDFAAMHLLSGKFVVVIENLQLVMVLPITFFELFHSPEDYYQKTKNASYTRIIRYLALFITIYVPAIYIAITTYNHEAIPSKLLINFAIQRDGVPFPSVAEAIIMLITFEIIKETDTRTPNIIGSSLSIVGALVLGEAAVNAGIVSPIMVIVIAITAISGLILSYIDVTNGVRWWRLIFLVFASVAGLIGVFIAGMVLLINLSSIENLGVPYLAPYAPLLSEDIGDDLILNRKKKYYKRKTYLSKNLKKGKVIVK